MQEIVKVVRTRGSSDIHAFVSHAEIGAKVELSEFINMLVEQYGNPATTLTKSGLKKGLLAAKEVLLSEMKKTTVMVASENLTPKPEQ